MRRLGVICLNGPAALKFQKDDEVIVLLYCGDAVVEAKKFTPIVVFPDSKTNQLKNKGHEKS